MDEYIDPDKGKFPLTRIADHDYFVIPSVTDVDKIRADAHERSQPTSKYGKPESGMVHHHRIGEECLYGMSHGSAGLDQRHDWYPVLKTEEDE